MDKAQGQEIKPLSCWVQPHAPITESNPASPDSSAHSLSSPHGTVTKGMAAVSLSLGWPASSLSSNHVANASSTNSRGFRVVTGRTTSTFCSRSWAQAPLTQNTCGPRPLLTPHAHRLPVGAMIWKTNCHTTNGLYRVVLSFMNLPPVKTLIKKRGNNQKL